MVAARSKMSVGKACLPSVGRAAPRFGCQSGRRCVLRPELIGNSVLTSLEFA